MKNTKLFIYTLLACLVLWVGFDISAARLKFGGATLNDSTASLITTNKGLRVNGVISSSDTLRTSGILRSTELQLTGSSPQILWTTYGMNIDGGIDVLNYNANAHSLNTEYGTVIGYVDSASGAGFRQIQGRGLVYNKLVKFATTSATLPAYINASHGLASVGSKIIGVSGYVQCDTTGWNLSGFGAGNDLKFPPRFTVSAAGTYDLFFDSLNVTLYLASGATAIRNNTDTAFVWVTYIVE
jgi:hypothetical protein